MESRSDSLSQTYQLPPLPGSREQLFKFQAVNYHRWKICDPACQLGAQLEVPVYVFLKDALIRRFGLKWYHELEQVHAHLLEE